MNNIILSPPNNSIAFYVLDIPIHIYGIIITCAIFLGILCAYYLIKNKYSKEFADSFLDFCPMVIIYSIIGARLFYILGDFSYYFKNPKEILMINHGGLSIWGAIIVGILAIYIYSKKLKMNFLKNLDIFALFMPLCQAIGRWGNFFNQEAYGKPAYSLIKYRVDIYHRFDNFKDIEFYHPTFLYEMILNIIIFIILFFIFKKNPKCGVITCLYLILYGIIRIFIEFIRIDSVCYLLNIPIAAIISAIAVILAAICLYKIQKS